jgi:hypothetical protein
MTQKFNYSGLEFRFVTQDISKSAKTDEWIIRGYAATNDLDRQGDVITFSAMKAAAEDLKTNSAVFYEHKHDQPPIGKVLDAGVDDNGLWVEVMVSKTKPDIWQLIQEGILSKFSIGGKVKTSKKEMDKTSGKEFNLITGMDLFEVSIVGLPANPQATFSASKSIVQSIQKAYERKEKLQNIVGGGANQMADSKQDETNPPELKVEKSTEPVVEKSITPEVKTELTKDEIKDMVEKKEKFVAGAVVGEFYYDIAGKKTPKTMPETTKVDEGNQGAQTEDFYYSDVTKEIEEIKVSLAEVLAAVKDIQSKVSVVPKEVPAAEIKSLDLTGLEEIVKKSVDLSNMLTKVEAEELIKKVNFDETKVEVLIKKCLDEKLGKIRLVPSRKGTLIKMDLEDKDNTEDSENLSVLCDEKKFDTLPETAKREVIRKGLLAVITSK